MVGRSHGSPRTFNLSLISIARMESEREERESEVLGLRPRKKKE